MKFKLPFRAKKREMNQETTNGEARTSQQQEDSIADELKLSSEVEASEQQPLEEDPSIKFIAEIAELKDTHLRLFAEFENYKRRTLKERSDLIKSAGSDILTALLPVLDDFDRAIKSANNTSDPALKEGISLIHGKLNGILEQRGLKIMKSIGEPFNVDLHEAITNVPVEDELMKDKVIDEVESGYYLNDKVIRYAKVVVGN